MQDVHIGESDPAQGVEILLDQARRLQGQLLRVGEDSLAACIEARAAPILLDALEQRVVLQQSAQTAPVVGRSVVATVEPADDQCHQLSIDLA